MISRPAAEAGGNLRGLTVAPGSVGTVGPAVAEPVHSAGMQVEQDDIDSGRRQW